MADASIGAQIAAWAAFAADDVGDAKAKRQRTAPARAARRIKAAMAKTEEQRMLVAVAEDRLALAAAFLGECRSVLSIPRQRFSDARVSTFVRMWSLQRLACMPRQRGTQLVMQNVACHLVSSAALHKQQAAFDAMVGHASAARAQRDRPSTGDDSPCTEVAVGRFRCSAFLGMRLMWDESAQRLRPLLDRIASSDPSKSAGAQAISQVMTLSCHLFAVALKEDLITGEFMSTERWEPWLTPMRILESTSTNYILEALVRNMPFCMDAGHPDRGRILQACDALVVVFVCDSASSNVRSIKWFMAHAEMMGKQVLVHAEACSVHQVHIVKAGCLEVMGMAGTLYSWTSLLRLSWSLSALQCGLKLAVESRLVMRCGRQPPAAAANFLAMVQIVFSIDGSEDFLFKRGTHGDRQPTAFYETIVELTNTCEVTAAGDLIVYIGDFPHAAQGQVKELALERIMRPLTALFVERRWSVAAISRWTHVMETLKRVVLGCLLGRVIIQAMASMTKRLGKEERELDAILEKAHRKEIDTGEAPNVAWAKDGKRLLKVARYMATPGRSWQFGCILLATSVCDQLHYGITGTGRGRANLHMMTDPADTILGKALASLWELCSDFRLDSGSRWALLTWLGAPDPSSMELRMFARKLLLNISCGLCRRLEIKFSSGVYRLYWMISPNTSDADRRDLAAQMLAADPHCLPAFVRHFIQLCPTVQMIIGPIGTQVIKTLSNTLIFSTDEVERENAHCRRACSSNGPGRRHGPTVAFELCRKLKEHHVQKGGLDPSRARATPTVVDCTSTTPTATSHFLAPPQASPLRQRSEQVPSAPAVCVATASSGPLGMKGGVSVRKDKTKAASKSGFKGNPKLAYINNRISMVPHRMTKKEWASKRKEFALAYDKMSDEQKETWAVVFRSQGCRRRCGEQGQRSKRAARAHRAAAIRPLCVTANTSTFAPIWDGNIEKRFAMRQSRGLLLSEVELDDYLRAQYGGSLEEVRKVSGGESVHTVKGRVKDRSGELDKMTAELGEQRLWGCAGCWHNICSKLQTPEHIAITQGLSSVVDSLGKEKVAEVDTVLACVGADARMPVMFLMLGWVLWRPKTQMFLLCHPLGVDLDEDGLFCLGMPEVPFELEIASRWSRLSSPSCQRWTTLHHLTSDEAAHHMLAKGVAAWDCWSVQQVANTQVASLLRMVVSGVGGTKTSLAKAARQSSQPVAKRSGFEVPDALQAFFNLPSGGFSASSASSARGGPSPTPPIALLSPHASSSQCAPAPPMLDDDMVGSFEEHLAAAMPLEMVEAAAGGAVEGEGATVASGDPEPLVARSEASAQVPPSVGALLDAAIDVAMPAAPPAANSASSASGTALAPGGPPSDDADDATMYTISGLGYVTHRIYEGKPIGRLTKFKTNISMSCYRHAGCSVVANGHRHSPDHMLRWLIAGVALPGDASSAERKAEAVRHKATFRKL